MEPVLNSGMLDNCLDCLFEGVPASVFEWEKMLVLDLKNNDSLVSN